MPEDMEGVNAEAVEQPVAEVAPTVPETPETKPEAKISWEGPKKTQPDDYYKGLQRSVSDLQRKLANRDRAIAELTENVQELNIGLLRQSGDDEGVRRIEDSRAKTRKDLENEKAVDYQNDVLKGIEEDIVEAGMDKNAPVFTEAAILFQSGDYVKAQRMVGKIIANAQLEKERQALTDKAKKEGIREQKQKILNSGLLDAEIGTGGSTSPTLRLSQVANLQAQIGATNDPVKLKELQEQFDAAWRSGRILK